MSSPRVLVYLLRRDLRLADNPIFSEIGKLHAQAHAPFTHLLPIYIFPSQQVETSGFLASDADKSPYPEARSQVGNFWRCGPLRAKFLAESVWDLKKGLENVGSGLEVRVGMVGDVVRHVLESMKEEAVGLWMTSEEGVEEQREEKAVRREVEKLGKEFKLWVDEKYFVDDRDVPYKQAKDLDDVFTSYRKRVEPLRDAPRRSLPAPKTLPPLPPSIPTQQAPFKIPTTLEATIAALQKPLTPSLDLTHPPTRPPNAKSAHPFVGGSTPGRERISHLITSGSMSTYKETRNGMLGKDFSTKLSAWLALGCITARQIHWALVDFEDARTPLGAKAPGYGKGENKSTYAVRFELLWRDYMRLCTRKFGVRLFRIEGFRDREYDWSQDREKLARWLEGTTGAGLVDASQRELFLTGYTSNRARQNVASYLSKHLDIDWRFGAEWYECCLIDYDLSSNWGNWQYNSGQGNDPRGESRVFNFVKQANDYDPNADYIKTWVPEVRGVDRPEQAWQCWKVPQERRRELGLVGNVMAEQPLKKIEYSVGSGKRRENGGGGGHFNPCSRRGSERGGRGGRGRGSGRRDEASKKQQLPFRQA